MHSAPTCAQGEILREARDAGAIGLTNHSPVFAQWFFRHVIQFEYPIELLSISIKYYADSMEPLTPSTRNAPRRAQDIRVLPVGAAPPPVPDS